MAHVHAVRRRAGGLAVAARQRRGAGHDVVLHVRARADRIVDLGTGARAVARGVADLLTERHLGIDVVAAPHRARERGGGVRVAVIGGAAHRRGGGVDLDLRAVGVLGRQGVVGAVPGVGADAEIEVAAVAAGGRVEAPVHVPVGGVVRLAVTAGQRLGVRHDVKLRLGAADDIVENLGPRAGAVARRMADVLAERHLDVDVRAGLHRARERIGERSFLVVAAAGRGDRRGGGVDLDLRAVGVLGRQGVVGAVLGVGADAEIKVAAVGAGGLVEAPVHVAVGGVVRLAVAAGQRVGDRHDVELRLGAADDVVEDLGPRAGAVARRMADVLAERHLDVDVRARLHRAGERVGERGFLVVAAARRGDRRGGGVGRHGDGEGDGVLVGGGGVVISVRHRVGVGRARLRPGRGAGEHPRAGGECQSRRQRGRDGVAQGAVAAGGGGQGQRCHRGVLRQALVGDGGVVRECRCGVNDGGRHRDGEGDGVLVSGDGVAVAVRDRVSVGRARLRPRRRAGQRPRVGIEAQPRRQCGRDRVAQAPVAAGGGRQGQRSHRAVLRQALVGDGGIVRERRCGVGRVDDEGEGQGGGVAVAVSHRVGVGRARLRHRRGAGEHAGAGVEAQPRGQRGREGVAECAVAVGGLGQGHRSHRRVLDQGLVGDGGTARERRNAVRRDDDGEGDGVLVGGGGVVVRIRHRVGVGRACRACARRAGEHAGAGVEAQPRRQRGRDRVAERAVAAGGGRQRQRRHRAVLDQTLVGDGAAAEGRRGVGLGRVDLVVRAGGERRMGDDGVGIAAVLDGAGVECQRVGSDADAVGVLIGCDHGVAEHQVGRAGAAVVGRVAGVAADGEPDARRAAHVHAVAERRRDLDVVTGDVLVVVAGTVQGERRAGVGDGAGVGEVIVDEIVHVVAEVFACLTCEGD